MKAEIDTLHVECPLCGNDIEVPVMVDQGTSPKRVTLTLQPDFSRLRAHAQGHLANPDPPIRIEGDKIIHRATGVADVERCWHGVPITENCGICGGGER